MNNETKTELVVHQKQPQGLAPTQVSAKVLSVIAGSGDLRELTQEERAQYIVALCESVGINPLSRPIEIMEFEGGRVVIYAKKECSDQLRAVHGISVEIVGRELVGDIFTVTARATDQNGRKDEDVGAVDIKGLQGMRLANAQMKAHTKAKRRVTLSIAGLSILDESEIDSLEDRPQQTVAQRLGIAGALPALSSGASADPVIAAIDEITKATALDALDRIGARLANEAMTTKQRDKVARAFAAKREQLGGKKQQAADPPAQAGTLEPLQKPEASTKREEECGACGTMDDATHAKDCPNTPPPAPAKKEG